MNRFARWVIACLAVLAFLAPLKFGTPLVVQSLMFPPREPMEWLIFSWPNQLAVIFVFGALVWLVLDSQRLSARVDLLFVLPLVFLFTQMLATPRSINPQVSADTLIFFGVCVLLFYVGAWYVRDGAAAAGIFGGLALSTAIVCVLALHQYFVGLQQTREFAALYLDPTQVPEEFLAKLTSNRVFASLVYPNALAGYLVLAFAPTLAWLWVRGRTWDRRVKWATLILFAALMTFCLALTGSRGGFVSFAAAVAVGLWCAVRDRSRRGMLVVALALVGLAVLFLLAQRGGLIRVGMESFEARADYWRGAGAIGRDHFWLGTGPGTFGSIYPKYRTAVGEDAQLVHNNFLQMFSDSGFFAFIAFAALWLVALGDAMRLAKGRFGDAAAVAIGASLTGWVIHALVDFDLYVPGVAIPAFLLLGALQGLKELRSVSPVAHHGRNKWLLGGLCVVLVGGVCWVQGRAWAANIAYARAVTVLPVDGAQALAEARRATVLAPNNAIYQAMAGEAAAQLGRHEEAVDHFWKAVQADPYRASYHWRLARAHLQAFGVDEEVLQHLRQAVALDPAEPRYRQGLSLVEESVRQSPGTLLESDPTEGQ